jgi:hypothetical protein
MRKLLDIIYIFSVFCFFACNNNQQTDNSNIREIKCSEDSLSIQAGKKWIKKNIESYFNNDANFLKGFSVLCSKQYYEFKQDATNIDLDGGMTEHTFKTKWGRRYSKYAGIGNGFMISQTDFGKIELIKIEFRNRTEMGGLLYNVLIIDKTFKSKFERQVVLIKDGNSFLIDDVLEISDSFEK